MTIEEIEKSDLKAGTFGVFTSTEKVRVFRRDKDIVEVRNVQEFGFYGGIAKKDSTASIIRYNSTGVPEYFPNYYKYEWIEFTPITEIPICEVV